ncbi:integrin beta-8 isoform X1 [Nerophis lumbriciformis]|uniref:integrin beta-8 isoform X1 n=1 Tax=Nerophis lumbriciformis TaxID=546530 RepID=UPI002ADF8A93|nr:integrin beta-8-like isoform X1 [Nerophis lumbriciformis]
MTSCPRTYGRVPLSLLLCLLVSFCAEAEASPPGNNVCSSPEIKSCTQCLRRGPQCSWCFKEDFLDGADLSHRCDLQVNLLSRGCGPEFTERSKVQVEVDATTSGTQVSPRDISITLTPGSDASFMVAVKQLPRYPVDLYYLVDVSASMQENLDHLKTVGVALSLRMTEHSSDLWLGFGSFVDKPVSPYINVHPTKINNPCSDYEIRCRPAHGFHHVLSMSGNMSEFTRVIKRQRISGNMDTPEGGLDAMLQAAVCQRAVGWRPEAKRLLLLMTDQPSHLALDSRLAGIVVPHDGLCHLEDNIYTGSTRMDHPSLGQLSEKLLENHIHSIFAVEKQQYQWYQELVHLLPASYLGKIGFFQSPNLIDLVVDAYKSLLAEVSLSVSVDDQAFSRYWTSVSPICPNGSAANNQSCSGVQPNQTVYFNVTIGLRSCPDHGADEDIKVMVRPVGYNESTTVRIHSKCQCSCGPTGSCRDSNRSPCAGTLDGAGLERWPHQGLFMNESKWRCRADGSNVDCGGRGVCECGRCVCEHSRLGTVFGKYCQMDDFSCPYKGGLLCGGRGMCVSGECVCEGGWTGDSCGCAVAVATCQSPDGSLCSGRGKCVCGRCVCDGQGYSGDLCERCPACQSSCQSNWKCVDCHVSRGLTRNDKHCNRTCASDVIHINAMLTGSRGLHCMYISGDSCRYWFQSRSESGREQLHISTRAECASRGRVLGTFLSVCALTVLCGLVVVAVSRLLLQKRGRSPEGATQDGDYLCTGKELAYIPTSNEKTVTYRRERAPDHAVEMTVHVKMPLGEPWQ